MAGIATKNTMSYTTAIMAAGRGSTKVVTSASGQTFAAKLTETASNNHPVPNPQMNPIKAKVSQPLNISQTVSSTPTSPPTQTQIPATSSHNILLQSPKHRPASTASAPPSMMQPSCSNKVPFPPSPLRPDQQPISTIAPIVSSHSDVMPSIANSMSNHQLQQQMLSQQLLQSHHQQRQHQLQQAEIQQAINHENFSNSTTPVVQPIKNNSSRNVALEYSLFDTFPKVQQSMWGRENNEKPINFAAATGNNVSQTATSHKFIDNDTPQVDASKAPGYRGATVCSPVASKSSTTPPSLSNYQNYEKQSVQSVQPPQQVHSGLAVARPISRPPTSVPTSMDVNLDLNSQPAYSNRNMYQPSMQPHLEGAQNLYKPAVSVGYNSSEANMLKMVPSENQQLMHQSFHHHQSIPHHIGSYSQPPPQQPPQPPQQVSTSSNTSTVTMSRLNPRAPDFSSSLHNLTNKHSNNQQQSTPSSNMFNTSGYHPGTIAPPSSLQHNSNLIMNPSNVPYQLNKPTLSNSANYQTSNGPPGSGRPQPQNQPVSNQQRWQFIHQNTYQPTAADIMCMPNISHIASLAQTSDYLNALDMANSSPTMSPNSGATNETQQRVAAVAAVMDDRINMNKVPRPIGTERAWKNYNANPMVPQQQLPATLNQLGAADLNEAAASMWLLNNEASKLTLNSWPNIAAASTGLDSRANMFRTYPSYNHRLPTDDMPSIDTTFSVSTKLFLFCSGVDGGRHFVGFYRRFSSESQF